MLTITVAIIAITSIISFTAFSNNKVLNDLIFSPIDITYRKQWYRFFTCGFIHADIIHLAFNMYSFYLFGDAIEHFFVQIFGTAGKFIFLLLYVSSLFFCLIPTYIQNKHNDAYRSLGASGAVSAVVFAFIVLAPTIPLGLIIIPGLELPSFVFGLIYLGISAYLSKKGNSYVNHSAHFWGAMYGIFFLLVACLLFSKFNPIENFIQQVTAYLHK
ncbi:MAG: rhomboid family intramembrane serine protease [Sphingobacteriia bacterium]|nr:rhomboid family intramembrane serine protease [Sphingobacteriia bacterium]